MSSYTDTLFVSLCIVFIILNIWWHVPAISFNYTVLSYLEFQKLQEDNRLMIVAGMVHMIS